MQKKPELYKIFGSERHNREEVNYRKIPIWNNLYYRRKGVRVKYKVTEIDSKRPRSDKYTRWQLHYDLKKPWHVGGRFPKDFATHAEAVEYATTKGRPLIMPPLITEKQESMF